MASNNAEGLNFKVVTTGNPVVDARPICNLRPVTLARVIEHIESMDLEDDLKRELRKSAGCYPENALQHWIKNLNKHTQNARRALSRSKSKKVAPPLEDAGVEKN